MTDADVAAEVTALIEERKLDPNFLIAGRLPVLLFTSGDRLPYDAVSVMVSLAHYLHVEPWYLYKFASQPLPKALLDVVKKQNAAIDKAAAKRTKKKLAAEERAAADAIRATLTTRICPSCRFELDRGRFYSSGAYCRQCTSENNRRHRLLEKAARAAEAAAALT